MNRLGFHYFPDSLHYQNSDLQTWLPKLQQHSASWLVLQTPVTRALPEKFIIALKQAAIEPILIFDYSPEDMPESRDFEVLFNVYARWGVKNIVLFDRPNMRSTWGETSWAQRDLVERFLDYYLPLAECAIKSGLCPIFPPLEPGGDYWDTTFLKIALEGISRRKHQALLDNLIIGSYAKISEHPLNYGKGGPEHWPGAQPYFTPKGEQDQRGLYIFDWYDAIVKSVLLEPRQIFLFGLGSKREPEKTIQVAQLLRGDEVENLAPIPEVVLGGAFWLLSASEESSDAPHAWYQPDGSAAPFVEQILQSQINKPHEASPSQKNSNPIKHYVLLPAYEWGIPDYHLDALRPYIKRHQPTIGFSIAEAAKAQRVTVIGSEEQYSEDTLRQLRAKGCIVERITGDGTTLASKVAKLN